MQWSKKQGQLRHCAQATDIRMYWCKALYTCLSKRPQHSMNFGMQARWCTTPALCCTAPGPALHAASGCFTTAAMRPKSW